MEMELKLRALLEEEELPEPDEMRIEGEELIVLWHDRKLALIVSPD